MNDLLEQLRHFGLLLQTDTRLPSVAGLVAGEPVRGSWWGHQRGHDIYRSTLELAARPDVVVTRLVLGKVTYVHRRLWAALLAAASSREAWQMRGLSREASALLGIVTAEGEMRSDLISHPLGVGARATGEAVRELERKLLIHSEEFHTSTGAHAKQLETWERWAERVALSRAQLSPGSAKNELEKTLDSLNWAFQAHGRLPWQ